MKRLHQYHLSLTLPEILGYALFYPLSPLGQKILTAYVSQKYSILRNNGYFYVAEKVENIELITERRLINHIVVTFDAWLRKDSIKIIEDAPSELVTEKEYRRYIDACHPLLVKKLRVSCNDLSNMRYISREIEILFGDYRLCINPAQQTYTIQYKNKTSCINVLGKKILFTLIFFLY